MATAVIVQGLKYKTQHLRFVERKRKEDSLIIFLKTLLTLNIEIDEI